MSSIISRNFKSSLLAIVFLMVSAPVLASYSDYLNKEFGGKVKIPENVILNESVINSDILINDATHDARNFGILGEDWQRKEFSDMASLERATGEQIPGRHQFLRTIDANKGSLKFVFYSQIKNSENTEDKTFQSQKINRVLFIFNQLNNTFIGQFVWTYEPQTVLFQSRYEQMLKNQYELPDNIYTYISLELKKDEPFADDSSYNSEYSRVIAAQTGTWFDSKVPYSEKANIIKAPYLWGKYFFKSQDEVDHARKKIAESESMDLDDSVFTARFFSGIHSLEEYIGQQVPLRPQQINWLSAPQASYLVYISNPGKKQLPYEHMIHMFDSRSHEQFMTILWNKDE